MAAPAGETRRGGAKPSAAAPNGAPPLPPAPPPPDAQGAAPAAAPAAARVPLGLTLTLGLYQAISPITMELYVPGLPVMADYFGTGVAELQSTIATLLVGMACAQLLVGNLSDTLGRKAVAIAGLGLYSLASVSAGLAGSIAQLQLQRAVQGVGAAISMVVGQATVRAAFADQRARERITSRLTSVRALSPLLAPALGAYLLLWFGWRSCFVVMAGLGGLGLLASRTLPPDPPRAAGAPAPSLAELGRVCAALATDGRYMRLLGADALNFAAFFSYVTASSYVLQRHYGVPLAHFGFVYGINAAGLIVGTELSPRLSALRALGGGVAARPSAGQRGVLRLGLGVSTLSACVLLGVAHADALAASYWSVVLPAMLFCTGRGLLSPQAIALAMEGYPQLAGSAAGFFFATRFVVSALVVTALGAVYDASAGAGAAAGGARAGAHAVPDASPLPLCWAMLCAQLCACASYAWPRGCCCRRRAERAGGGAMGVALADHDGAAGELPPDSPMEAAEEGRAQPAARRDAGDAADPAAAGLPPARCGITDETDGDDSPAVRAATCGGGDAAAAGASSGISRMMGARSSST